MESKDVSEGSQKATDSVKTPEVKASAESLSVIKDTHKGILNELKRLAPTNLQLRQRRGEYPVLADALGCIVAAWKGLSEEQRNAAITRAAEQKLEEIKKKRGVKCPHCGTIVQTKPGAS